VRCDESVMMVSSYLSIYLSPTDYLPTVLPGRRCPDATGDGQRQACRDGDGGGPDW
jgi:hypothetical protein